jgi:hypothetical protein
LLPSFCGAWILDFTLKNLSQNIPSCIILSDYI